MKVYIPIKISSDLEDVASPGNRLALNELSSLSQSQSPSPFAVFSLFELMAKRLNEANKRGPIEVALSPEAAALIVTKNPNWPRSIESEYGFKILELELNEEDITAKKQTHFLKPETPIVTSALLKIVNGENYLKEKKELQNKENISYLHTLSYGAFNPRRDGQVDRSITDIELIKPTLSEKELQEGAQRRHAKVQEHNSRILESIRKICEGKKGEPLRELNVAEIISQMNNSSAKTKYGAEDRLLVLLAIFAKAQEIVKQNPHQPLKIDKITNDIENSLNTNGFRYFNDNLLATHSSMLFRKKSNTFRKIVDTVNRIHSEYSVSTDSIPAIQKAKRRHW